MATAIASTARQNWRPDVDPKTGCVRQRYRGRGKRGKTAQLIDDSHSLRLAIAELEDARASLIAISHDVRLTQAERKRAVREALVRVELGGRFVDEVITRDREARTAVDETRRPTTWTVRPRQLLLADRLHRVASGVAALDWIYTPPALTDHVVGAVRRAMKDDPTDELAEPPAIVRPPKPDPHRLDLLRRALRLHGFGLVDEGAFYWLVVPL